MNYHVKRGDGYVYSQTVKGAQKELKDYVFDEEGYAWIGGDYKIKSRIYPREISVIGNNGKPMKKRIDEKQIIFYSRDYNRYTKAGREPALLKAMELERIQQSTIGPLPTGLPNTLKTSNMIMRPARLWCQESSRYSMKKNYLKKKSLTGIMLSLHRTDHHKGSSA